MDIAHSLSLIELFWFWEHCEGVAASNSSSYVSFNASCQLRPIWLFSLDYDVHQKTYSPGYYLESAKKNWYNDLTVFFCKRSSSSLGLKVTLLSTKYVVLFKKYQRFFLGLMQVSASAVNVKIWYYLYFELLGMYHFVNMDFRYQTTHTDSWWELKVRAYFKTYQINPDQNILYENHLESIPKLSWRMQLSNEKNEKRIHFSVAP